MGEDEWARKSLRGIPTTESDKSKFIERYFDDYHIAARLSDESRRELVRRGSATSALDELLETDAVNDVWDMILALLAAARTDDEVEWVGVASLEDLIRTQPDVFGRRLVAEAQINARMRTALRAVWGWDDVPAGLREQVQRILAKSQ